MRATLTFEVTIDLADPNDYDPSIKSWRDAALEEASLVGLSHSGGVDVSSFSVEVSLDGDELDEPFSRESRS
jgi:hypothetical protein